MRFGAMADEVLANKTAEDGSQLTLEKSRWLLEKPRRTAGQSTKSQITAAEILQLLKRIE